MKIGSQIILILISTVIFSQPSLAKVGEYTVLPKFSCMVTFTQESPYFKGRKENVPSDSYPFRFTFTPEKIGPGGDLYKDYKNLVLYLKFEQYQEICGSEECIPLYNLVQTSDPNDAVVKVRAAGVYNKWDIFNRREGAFGILEAHPGSWGGVCEGSNDNGEDPDGCMVGVRYEPSQNKENVGGTVVMTCLTH